MLFYFVSGLDNSYQIFCFLIKVNAVSFMVMA